MKIVDIVEATAPLQADIRNAYIDFRQMTTSIVAIITDVIKDGRPVVGFGFNSNGRYSVSGLLKDRFIPRILAADPQALLDDSGENFDPHRIWQVMMTGEKPGGHGDRAVAVGAIDMAVWDAVAKIEGKPLYQLLADRYRGGKVDKLIFTYAAGGYYQPGKDIAGLKDELQGYIDAGYNTVKIKIGGASLKEDLERIEAALSVVGSGQALAVDANGRFDVDTALEYAHAMAQYDLRWYEEPGDPLDFELLARVAQEYEGPLATGENLFSWREAQNLLRYGGMRPDRDIIQIDPALAYGLVEYLRVLEVIEEAGWTPRCCIPHGGHLFALHIAAGLGLGGNEDYPGVFQPFGGFADDIAMVDGMISPPDAPGIGHETKNNLYQLLRTLVD